MLGGLDQPHGEVSSTKIWDPSPPNRWLNECGAWNFRKHWQDLAMVQNK